MNTYDNCTKEICLDQFEHKVHMMRHYAAEGKQNIADVFYYQADGMLDGLFFAGVIKEDEYFKMGEDLTAAWMGKNTTL